MPKLPEGMSVDIVAAYRINFCVGFPVRDFYFNFTFSACMKDRDSNSGQNLDAQSWSIGNGRLMAGTEDGDALNLRMPWIETEGENYPIEYLGNGLRLVMPYAAPKNTVGFHFILAYNRVDVGCGSEWFAVDVPHDRISDLPYSRGNRGITKR
jgi:hypothetical protein